jgi:hypothetical protein
MKAASDKTVDGFILYSIQKKSKTTPALPVPCRR